VDVERGIYNRRRNVVQFSRPHLLRGSARTHPDSP
jgi:hypothetical protein